MLDALDETIKAILRERGGLDSDEIDIAFDAPDREWAAKVGKPTVNCYLYDIRENLERRETDWLLERQQNGHVVSKRLPPRRFDLSYVCTAWTADVEDEHRLLWRVLATLVRVPVLPRELLRGELADAGYKILTEVAQPDGLLRDPADVWSALDNRIRPSVNFVATLPLDYADPFESPLVLTKRLWVREFGQPAEELIQIGGLVLNGDGAPQPSSVVRIRDHAFSTVSAGDGRFWLAGIPAGDYTLIAEFDGRRGERAITVPGDGYDVTLEQTALGPGTEKGGKASERRPRRG